MNDLGKGYDRAGKYKFRIDLSNEKKVRVVQLCNYGLGMTCGRGSLAATNRNSGEK